MDILIRKAVFEDKEAVNRAHCESIQKICIQDYTQDQVDKWSNVKYSDDIWRNTVENDCCYIVEADGRVEGVCHSRIHNSHHGEIVGMYITPKALGLGIGRKLFEKCMEYLIDANVDKVTISGTKTALSFYQKMGFELREKVMAEIRGAQLETYNMQWTNPKLGERD
jgi:N-acetylglutamate synthase-like GNAT family acetyltransferase